MSQGNSNSRRDFVKLALGAGGAVLLANSVMAQERRRGGAAPSGTAATGSGGGDLALPLVKPGEGMAASVQYHFKNSDVKDAKLKVDRAGVPFAQQTCSKCMLYTKAGMKDGEEVGKCTLFAGMLVKGGGWCASWSKKA
ncbi:MAG: high-potential iron-sulfur protein [Pseudobdellovibrionaceae bacterium]